MAVGTLQEPATRPLPITIAPGSSPARPLTSQYTVDDWHNDQLMRPVVNRERAILDHDNDVFDSRIPTPRQIDPRLNKKAMPATIGKSLPLTI